MTHVIEPSCASGQPSGIFVALPGRTPTGWLMTPGPLSVLRPPHWDSGKFANAVIGRTNIAKARMARRPNEMCCNGYSLAKAIESSKCLRRALGDHGWGYGSINRNCKFTTSNWQNIQFETSVLRDFPRQVREFSMCDNGRADFVSLDRASTMGAPVEPACKTRSE